MKQNNKNGIIIGITGKTGSGKTAFADCLSKKGVFVINADQIVSELYKTDAKLIKSIKSEFGDNAIKDGVPDREYLSDIVFNDEEKLKKLNAIVHKRVAEEIRAVIAQNKDKKHIALDVPIPVKEGFLDLCDIVLTIVAGKEQRIGRIMTRHNISANEAKKRLDAQLSDQQYMDLADIVIYNTGSLDELNKKVTEFLKGFI